MSLGIWQIVIIAVLVVLLFGRGKISELMGDVAKGITSFRKGLKENDELPAAPKDVTPKLNAEANVEAPKAESEKTKV